MAEIKLKCKPRIDIYIPGDSRKADLLFELLDEYGTKLYPWQRFVLSRWLAEDDEEKFVNMTCGLSVPRQSGKELAESTDIPTPIGWKKLKNIQVGDLVFGDDGKPTKVIAKYEPKEKKFYEIDFGAASDFVSETVKAGGGHLWEVLTDGSEEKVQVVDTNFLYEKFSQYKSSKEAIRIRLAQPAEYPEQELPLDPYCLGLWLGKDNASSGQEIKGIKPTLEELKLINNKHIPEIYLQASTRQRYELLRGLMDSSGRSDNSSSRVSFCQTGNIGLVKQFMELVCSLGMRPSYKVKRPSLNKPKEQATYEVFFKLRGSQEHNYWYIKGIRKIKKDKDEHYYCLAVDNPSHLFLCSKSYIPTHNTEMVVARIIYGIIFRGAVGLYTAQQLATAEVVKKRVQNFFYNNPHEEIFNLLTPRFRNKKPVAPDYMEFINGAYYRFTGRSRMNGLGQTYDEVINDEAADMLDSHEETLRPTVSSGHLKNPQFVYCGTPPMAETVGEVFPRTRKRLLEGAKGCWTEWGVETLADPQDRETWRKANPSLGLCLLESAVEAEAASMSIDGFNRMRLGWWAGVENKRAIAQADWDKCYTEKPELDDDYSPVYAVKFSPDRSTYALAVALPLKGENDRIHVELVKYASMNTSFNKIAKWFVEPPFGQKIPRWRQASLIIVDGSTGQDILIEDLISLGVASKRIHRPNVREIGAAHEFTFTGIKDGSLSHFRQPALEQTVRLTKTRTIGRNGGFGWASMNPNLTTAALDAVTLAYWGAKTHSKKKKTERDVEDHQNRIRNVLAGL